MHACSFHIAGKPRTGTGQDMAYPWSTPLSVFYIDFVSLRCAKCSEKSSGLTDQPIYCTTCHVHSVQLQVSHTLCMGLCTCTNMVAQELCTAELYKMRPSCTLLYTEVILDFQGAFSTQMYYTYCCIML